MIVRFVVIGDIVVHPFLKLSYQKKGSTNYNVVFWFLLLALVPLHPSPVIYVPIIKRQFKH
jgi:hypothetical protein